MLANHHSESIVVSINIFFNQFQYVERRVMLQQSVIEWKDLTLRLFLDFLKKMYSFYIGIDLMKELFSATSNTSIQC